MTQPSTALLDFLTELATRAGEVTLKYFQTDIAVETKADESPVTIADRETEQFLRAEIARRFPGDAIIGEEYGEKAAENRSGQRWILDPIDGTKAFVHGVPIYGVVIGVEQDGEIVAGAVNMPALGELIVGEKGHGAWWKGRRAQVSKVATLKDAVILTTDYPRNRNEGHGASWESLVDGCYFTRTWGDCYGHVLVATGRAEAMLDPIVAPWDCSGLKVILEEAGGTFTDYTGTPNIYGGKAFSTNGVLYDEVIGAIRRLD